MNPADDSRDLRELGRGLAQAAGRRGAAPAEALRAIMEALPSLLGERSELLGPIQDLLRDPTCTELLGCSQPDQRLQLQKRLFTAQRATGASPALAAQQIFLEGVLEGWPRRRSANTPGLAMAAPDLRSWLVGLATGILMGGVGGLLALTALRAMGVDLLDLNHSATLKGPVSSMGFSGSPGSARTSSQPALLHLVSRSAIPRRCANVALPAAEQLALADATNYDQRLREDAHGAAIPSRPSLIVLHETVLDLPDTIALFQRQNPDDAAQGSYHILIGRDGQRVRIVPDHARAFGAGDSAFGDLRFQTSATNPPSINNVALHVSLESPPDGRGDAEAHEGYTPAQYRSLAAQVLRWQALYGIPMDRVTTHAAVDRSHSRYDPRSFRWERFDQDYSALRRRCG